MQYIFSLIHSQIGITPVVQGKLWSTAIASLLIWILHELTNRFILRKAKNGDTREYYLRKLNAYICIILGTVIIGRIWLEGFESIGTIIGFASAGLALALKDPITNLAGWFYIIWERPFSVGDRVEVDGVMGDVVDQQMLQFTVMEIQNWVSADQHTARMTHIPNGKVFTMPLHNYNDDLPYLWDEIGIRLTFESDWEKAKKIVQKILEKHVKSVADTAEMALENASHHFLILAGTESLQPSVYTRVEDFGILLHARYMVDYKNRRGTSHAIWEDVLRAFDKEVSIDFAYPTKRLFSDQRRGNTQHQLLPDPTIQSPLGKKSLSST